MKLDICYGVYFSFFFPWRKAVQYNYFITDKKKRKIFTAKSGILSPPSLQQIVFFDVKRLEYYGITWKEIIIKPAHGKLIPLYSMCVKNISPYRLINLIKYTNKRIEYFLHCKKRKRNIQIRLM